MFKIILVLFSFIIFCFSQDCVDCHKIEKFDELNHNFSCIECHIKPNKRSKYSHKDIILNPSSMENVDLFCINCHKNEINSLKSSNHYTLKNEINLTRKLWGNKESNLTLQSLPIPKEKIDNTKDLVDDFLRRKCLKCHIGSQGTGEKGMYRGKGCMSCHITYNELGTYKGSDLTIKGKRPRAKIHKLDKKPSMSTCLSCHNKEFVGGDYLGLFPKDYDHAYRAPLTKEGKYPKTKYGIDFHYLKEDIHLKKGLTCVNCHKKISEKTHKMKTLSCKDCHKKISKNEAHLTYHDNVSCNTCHASWQMSNYELSVFRDDTKDYDKWKNLMMQEDTYLQNFLNKAIKSKKKPKPSMPDWITKDLKDGIWYSGWRFRRWTPLLLGNDEENKVKILRPMFQYRISYRDKNGNMILDDVHKIDKQKIEAFIPYSPHTIGEKAKSCESCHENPYIFSPKKNTNTVLDLFNGIVYKGSALSKKQKDKMNSKKYKKIRARMFLKED